MIEITDNNNYNSYIIKYSNEELVNETWKCLRDIPLYFKQHISIKDRKLYNIDYIFVSNLGRVIELKNGIYLLKRAIPNKSQYLHINIKKLQYRINRLVAYLYCDNDDPSSKIEVNHLNECQYDNRCLNLEWCTPKHNTNHGTGIYRAAISKSITQTNLHYKHTKETLEKLNQNRQRISEAGAKATSRSITRININTGEVVIYESITKAALSNNCSNTTIYDCCRGKLKSYKNYKFSYTDGNKAISRNRKIIQLSTDDQFIKEYANSKEVSKAGFNTYYVNRCCKGLQFVSGGYKWMYLEDYNQ